MRIREICWTMGAYDAVFTAEAADDETMTAFAATMAAVENIRIRTLRAFSADEMNGILRELPTIDLTSK